jgi:hypothetical protein
LRKVWFYINEIVRFHLYYGTYAVIWQNNKVETRLVRGERFSINGSAIISGKVENNNNLYKDDLIKETEELDKNIKKFIFERLGIKNNK